MDELDDAPEGIFCIVVPAAAQPRRQQVQQGPEAFAARAENVFSDLLDEFDVRPEAFMDPLLHALHVGFEFFEDVLDRRDHNATPGVSKEIIGETGSIVKKFQGKEQRNGEGNHGWPKAGASQR